VVSIGLSGIGKSTSVNSLLLKYLPNIGKEGWPKDILYRYNTVMLRFYLEDKIKPKVKLIKRVTLPFLTEYTLPYDNQPIENNIPIIFLELAEVNEYDP
jgi:hypothetical protein